MAAGYIPSTELTLVYDGLVDFPSGENIISISFNEPYSYLDGNNLVMMVRKADTANNSPSDCFKAQTVGTNRSRCAYSDSTINPTAPPLGNLSGQFPLTTFMMIPAGHISGTVTGANNQALSGVAVSLSDSLFTTTNDAGQYQLINVLPDTYTLAFNAHGYHEHTQTVLIEPTSELTINVTMQLLPQVSVTGTILASDTGAGLAGAAINLAGFEDYSVSTNAAGVFTIPDVFADNTYVYSISANGYHAENGQVTVGSTNYNMGQITLVEIAYAPIGVMAEENDEDTAVNITWLAPDINAPEIVESFEDTEFPPNGWTQSITNNGPSSAVGVYPTWCRIGTVTVEENDIVPTEGGYQAGLFWDNNHQDEWLITPSFICPPSAYMTFDTYVFLGSIEGDHYYVKVSTDDGVTWTVLWDASAQTGGWNQYSIPVNLDLSAYGGNQVKVAFHAIDPPDQGGLWYHWFIDNVYIGNLISKIVFNSDDFIRVSASGAQRQAYGTMPIRAGSRRMEEGNTRAEPRISGTNGFAMERSAPRVLTGYMIYRLQAEQEQNETSWEALLNEPTDALSLNDSGWATLPNGDYRWAVKAVYTNGVYSVPSFSNTLNKFVERGNIIGMVKDEDNHAIAGATVTAGNYSATSNANGAYSITLPVGTYDVTATADGFKSQTIENKTVYANSNTSVNFIMIPVSNDENTLPVVATLLNGNYPNPFNPETTISYSIKEPGHVKLEVYNLKGQLVQTLVDEDQATGHYKLVFDAKDKRERSISSGVYLLRMTAPGYQKTTKMILMR